MNRILLDQLMAQIAIYTGRTGGLADLQHWYNLHHLLGMPTECQECGRMIEGSHAPDCPIVLNYYEKFGKGYKE